MDKELLKEARQLFVELKKLSPRRYRKREMDLKALLRTMRVDVEDELRLAA